MGTDGRLIATDGPWQLQSNVTQKQAKYQKSGPNKYRYCALV